MIIIPFRKVLFNIKILLNLKVNGCKHVLNILLLINKINVKKFLGV